MSFLTMGSVRMALDFLLADLARSSIDSSGYSHLIADHRSTPSPFGSALCPQAAAVGNRQRSLPVLGRWGRQRYRQVTEPPLARGGTPVIACWPQRLWAFIPLGSNHGRRCRVMCKKSAELRQTLANCERLSQIRSMMVRVHWLETEMESAKRSRFATGLGNGNEKIGRRCVQLNVRRFPVM